MKLDLEKLKQKKEAPKKGQILAYTRKEVIFSPYDDVEEARGMLGDDSEILELHMFDSGKEYRAVCTESKRGFKNSAQGTVEHVAKFRDSPEEVFKEDVLLEPKFGKGKISVLNHISYNEGGMAVIDDYRLMMEGQK